MTLFSWLSHPNATVNSASGSGAAADDDEDAPIGMCPRAVQRIGDPAGAIVPPDDDIPRTCALSLFAHNAASFACKGCTFVAQDMQALRRHRHVTFEDRFFAPCACEASFPARITAIKHATQCQTVTSTSSEPAEESEPAPPSETRAGVATATVCTPAQVFAPVLPNPHDADPPDESMEPQDPPTLRTPRLRVPGWQASPPQRRQHHDLHGHRHVTDSAKLAHHAVPRRPDRIDSCAISSCTRRPDDREQRPRCCPTTRHSTACVVQDMVA